MTSAFVYPDSRDDIETAEDLRDIMLHGSVNAFCNKLGAPQFAAPLGQRVQPVLQLLDVLLARMAPSAVGE